MAEETQRASETADLLTAPYSVVLTSCARFDLLRRTVASLLETLDTPPEKFIIIEDSGDPDIRAALEGLAPQPGGAFEILLNAERLGQMRAIDRAYREVDTPLVFHCEDDWSFFRSGFLDQSRRLLAARPDVSMVSLRPRSELNPKVQDTPETLLEDGRGAPFGYLAFDPAAHPEYFSYSFNPGLRRLADFQRFAPVAALGFEEDVSYAFKKAGFRMAALSDPAVRHIGDGAHVEDPTSRPKPRTLSERLARSLRKRIKRARRALRL